MIRTRIVIAIAVAAMEFTACGSSDKSRAEKVINEGLAKAAQCTRVPIGIPFDRAKVGEDGAIGLLKAKGLIIEGKIKEERMFGGTIERDGYIFTESGKALVQSAGTTGFMAVSPCVRTGKFQITQIEAIDYGSTADGRPVANVRAKIKFVSEPWLADTRRAAAWDRFWNSVSESENAQWLYQLTKSGEELYYSEPGHALK